jgi:hypothetical protein
MKTNTIRSSGPVVATGAALLLLLAVLAAPAAAHAGQMGASDPEPVASPQADTSAPAAGQPAAQAPAQPATPAQPAAAQARPGPPVAEDNSLTPAEYRAKGLPAVDKPWTDAEYAAAAKALEAILAADPSQLPRRESPKSGPVFARLVAVENFAPLEKKRQAADQRLSQAGRYGNAVQQLASIYARATNQYKKSFDAELVDLSAFNLELADRLRVLGDELVQEVTYNDPQHDKREEVRDRIHYSFVAVIDSALAAFPQHHAYRKSELARFAGKLGDVLPRLYPVLPDNAKRDLPARLEKLANDEQDPALKEALLGVKAKLA